ncbi:MAG: sulfotransferase domain-containing protein [Deltaproteobacteria bacterium]|nr:sulfotransferase domain-containing protein [Deltaproteobacteria bacterium]
MLQVIQKKFARFFVRRARFVMSMDRAREIEHRFRGREEYRRLQLADHVVVSYPKGGRTWLRTMISRYYQLVYDLPESAFLNFDNLHRRDARVPRVFFTHDSYVRKFTGNIDSKRDFYDKNVLMLMRNPRDVAVSQFFQWRYRMRPRKVALNHYPDRSQDLQIFDFVLNEDVGLPAIITWMNSWYVARPELERHFIVRYEDLRARPEETFGPVMGFLGEAVRPEWVADAVNYGSIDNMRSMERRNYFWASGSRLAPRDKANPDSYKVRRAKVGGYRDYFDDEQLAVLDSMVRERLDPEIGYHEKDETAAPETSGETAAQQVVAKL